MKKNTRIQTLLRRKIAVLDGAVGTLLQQQGMPAGVSPETWALQHKDVLARIHQQYVHAGSDIIYSCTFGANRRKLAHYYTGNIRQLNASLVRIAKKAAGIQAFVAGDIGPTGEFVKPFGTMDFDEAVDIYKEQIRGLLEGGVDALVIETMMDIQEARAALIAVRELTDIFTMVTMTYEKDGRTLNGTDPVTALITLQSLGADAVGCNCSTGPENMLHFIASMKPYATVPLVAKPNAGMPRLEKNGTVFDMDPRRFASYAKEFVQKGVNLMGGCCGTTPAHIRELSKRLNGKKPILPVRESLAALSSAQHSVIFEDDRPFLIIGERINPTGKKALQEALSQGQFSLVRTMAKEQQSAGAEVLDVNVGMPGIDEKKLMLQALGVVVTSTPLPVAVDSANSDVVSAALRVYPGRALVNSVSGEQAKMKRLFPQVKKYGAMAIILPLRDKELPVTMLRRKEIILSLCKCAQQYGLSKDDLIVDALCMTISADPRAAIETLKTIAWCTDILRCRTSIGISNVSFGMPQRPWVNAAFLAMAATKGLTMAIANPSSKEFMNMKMAIDVLRGKDKDSTAFISYFSKNAQAGGPEKTAVSLTPTEKVSRAVMEGNREDIVAYCEEALKSGVSAADIVQTVMIPAINAVGGLYEKKEYFLPQLIASAEAMKKAMAHVEPLLKSQSVAARKAMVLLATVEGDIHDIGKNIVGLMLKNQGYDVTDLGKDVSKQSIYDAVLRHQPSIIGLSALMTTTMAVMKDTIEYLRQKGFTGSFVVGGAVLNQSYAEGMQAYYAKDGVDAVRVFERISSSSSPA